MANDPTSPIVRLTPDQRLADFTAQSDSIYNKFSPYDDTGPGFRVGFQQPYVWTKISDSGFSKHLTKYDSQAIPLGSTVRDEIRMGKFMASGTGLLFIGKQYLIQRQTAFNETRIYNPLSVLAATAVKGSTGLINRPTRYLETGGGGLVNFAKSSLLSLIGQSVAPSEVQGVASGDVSPYAKIGLGAKGKGLVHLEAAKSAQDRFSSMWVGASGAGNGSSGNFLQKLGTSLLSRFVPSTQPLGFGKTDNSNWVYRVEYPKDKDGAYHAMLDDSSGFFNFSSGTNSGLTVADVHKYFPGVVKQDNGNSPSAAKDNWYANPSLSDDALFNASHELPDLYKNLSSAVFKFNEDSMGNPVGVPRKSREQSQETIGNNYQKSAGSLNTKPKMFTDTLTDPLTLDKRGFSKAPANGQTIGTQDTYNSIIPFKGDRDVDGDNSPQQLRMPNDGNNSLDIIYFYFYDLVNSKYVPFRATINGLNDVHSPDWEEISYLGRADKLYVYKGFTHEVNFAFTVYANSADEMLPMWTRINYLVGLTRPSKYTSADSSKSFMYPPMTTFRIGDMYVDQPCIIKSVGITVPDDSTWESQRGPSEAYSYLKGTSVNLAKYQNRLYQLPKKVDISVQMSIMEKEKSIVDGEHFFHRPQGYCWTSNIEGYRTTQDYLPDLNFSSNVKIPPKPFNPAASFDVGKIDTSGATSTTPSTPNFGIR